MCRTSIDESKFKVTITIENTEHQMTNTWPLPEFSISALLNGLGIDDFNFGHSEIRMNLETDNDMRIFMRDLGISITDLDSLILDTE